MSKSEAYAKFVEAWPRQYDPQSQTGKQRFTIADVRVFVRGACDLIAEDIRAGKVVEEEAKEKADAGHV